MILISQESAIHSRLGNSLMWMSQLYALIENSGHTIFCPYAYENFSNYFPVNSIWLREYEIDSLFYQKVVPITYRSDQISRICNYLIRNYSHAVDKNPNKGEAIIPIDQFTILLTGEIDFNNPKIYKLIAEYKNIIIHEPFNFIYVKNINDHKIISPCELKFNEQSAYVNSIASGKKIGLHIRQGDYRTWQGGKYFYSDEFWIKKFDYYKNLKNSIFIFCNENDSYLISTLKNSGAIIVGDDFNKSFLQMMCMDEIYGPPSSYSNMAVNIANSVLGRNIIINSTN